MPIEDVLVWCSYRGQGLTFNGVRRRHSHFALKLVCFHILVPQSKQEEGITSPKMIQAKEENKHEMLSDYSD
jgi:hypothetical protein